jgi:hypothetical protein
MRLENQHIHERGLSVVQVAYYSDIANHLREGHHIQQKTTSLLSVSRVNSEEVRTPCQSASAACPSPPLSISAL